MSARSFVGAIARRMGLGPAVDAVARRRAVRRERRAHRAWRDALRRALAGAPELELVAGAVDPDAVPVIMCLWNRPERIDAILEELAAQRLDRSIRLVLWNNRPEHSEGYRRRLRSAASGAISSIQYVDSSANLGGVARFVVARRLAREGMTGAFVTLDDDQAISEGFVAALVDQHAPSRIGGVWAWVHGLDYWDRRRATPDEDASYVGTGGAVFDFDIVADPGFFDRLPDRFGFLEDMWASAWVRAHGGRLRAVEAEWAFVLEERDQYTQLIGLKPEFARYLAEHPPA